MILGLISSIAATESVAMLIEGSALAITTFYAAKKGKSVRRKQIQNIGACLCESLYMFRKEVYR